MLTGAEWCAQVLVVVFRACAIVLWAVAQQVSVTSRALVTSNVLAGVCSLLVGLQVGPAREAVSRWTNFLMLRRLRLSLVGETSLSGYSAAQ